MTIDIEQLRGWIDRSQTVHETVTPVPLRALTAMLDRDDAPQNGDAVPPLWHWLYFLPLTRQSEIAADGHAKRSGFLPPVPLPRRMWAGSRISFERPLTVGSALTRTSRIADVSAKDGRTGPLVFVRVIHELSDERGLVLTDEKDIVYRDHPRADESAPPPKAAPTDAQWSREVHPDPVLLFRYSALTFNGHRIHYDRSYATEVEGYPGLVVHGPLIATLMLDGLRRALPEATVTRFACRAVKPTFDIAPFSVCGRVDGNAVRLWAQDADGYLAMDATATLA